MERVEQRLEIAPAEYSKSEPEQEPDVEVVKVLERTQLLVWVEQLALPELCIEERLCIVARLRTALNANKFKDQSPSEETEGLVKYIKNSRDSHHTLSNPERFLPYKEENYDIFLNLQKE